MRSEYKIAFWVVLSILIFTFFRWLFGIAMPEIALSFSIGTTVLLVAGLLSGRAVILIVIRTNTINLSRITATLSSFIIFGLIVIAFLLNAMIDDTTFFPFFVTVLLLFLVVGSIGSLITILRHQFKSRVLMAQVEMAQSKHELQLLQAQLSPHFLFNTLNNLYGLSLTDPAKVPSLLLKLSELLRYSVYDVKETFVPLQYEADYLRNYIEFERLRLGERLVLQVTMDPSFDSSCTIPPLLLVVFVENAFKHSRNTSDEKIHIEIDLHRNDNSITFSVKNSYSTFEQSATGIKHSGFGLDSVRKRLRALYAGKHLLKIDREENQYAVQLTLMK